MVSEFVETSKIRSAFCAALSEMYRTEVPLYAELIDIVDTVNARTLAASGGSPAEARLGVERHGAIRLGTDDELATMARAFAVMGMEPVGYYDLAAAGVPVHSTAFRPILSSELERNPFRVFTSLLRTELIEDEALREQVVSILARRQIFSNVAVELIARAESDGGLGAGDAARFVAALMETFRWHPDATVDAQTYQGLVEAHRLIADIVAFKGPHINHLTPRVLDIDAAQAEMRARGIDAKDEIEGPPTRRVPILLRQTSFKALSERVRFTDQKAGDEGRHTARFGEIEQRGIALTPKGRSLYDRLLNEARQDSGAGEDHGARLARIFAAFPDDLEALREQKLAYFRYAVDPDGSVVAHPVTYEDFLPVSAAGIFQSNLSGASRQSYSIAENQAAFEAALGKAVLDPFALYADIEAQSLAVLGDTGQSQ
ncbi:VOC family protein [Sphingobium sp. CR2-8]|uniref:2-oxoadipate dioxygenase/decarboxylase HglS n=1 Tax=Sphingobium sp. CR2-8 TaxID=1306534 RepID=UPI002DB74F8B|nr:VOC family protein [Sphingobium sp. CR2-8]MEC3909450.1 VOC family protein [Sphingobium sp. CR2-8]